MEWFRLSHDRDKLRVLANSVVPLAVTWAAGNVLTS